MDPDQTVCKMKKKLAVKNLQSHSLQDLIPVTSGLQINK